MDHDALFAKLRKIFREEAAELLQDLETALLSLETNYADKALVDQVFRCLHTLKGSGSTSGFHQLSQYLHEVEDVYSLVRDGAITLDPALLEATLQVKDIVLRHLDGDEQALDANPEPLRVLQAYLKISDTLTPPPVLDFLPIARSYRIHFSPQPDFYRFGNDPLVYLNDLRALGTCSIKADTSLVPDLLAIDPEAAYISWTIELQTDRPRSDIEQVFAFLADECSVAIHESLPTPPAIQSWLVEFSVSENHRLRPDQINALLAELATFGELAIELQPHVSAPSFPIGTWRLAIACSTASEADLRDAFLFTSLQPIVAASQHRTAAPAPATPKAAATDLMRVPAAKLDALVDQVGELVILKSQLAAACKLVHQPPPELAAAAEALERLALSLRDLTLDVRTTPIGDTFERFKRTVRDIAKSLGKQVRVVLEGADTAIDKTLIDCLQDPLVHLIRNCVDHGIESPDTRIAAGKEPEGVLLLSAEQQGDTVRIKVADDGRGIDAAKVLAKATQRGIVKPDQRLSEDEILQLVFQPGFSTADSVSQLSGRGVGLDVVKRQIERLRGSIELRSEPGRGASITLCLPLTLAIIDGLLVGIEDDQYVLPLALVHETFELPANQRQACNGRNLVERRGALLPYLDLRPLFGYRSARPKREKVVVVEIEGQMLGLVVDAVIGNHQTVLKSLGWAAGKARVFSGSTVLPNGRIGLICDVPALLAHSRCDEGADDSSLASTAGRGNAQAARADAATARKASETPPQS